MSYRIPIGPYHPALEEPYKLELVCEGESVVDSKLVVGFNFRGIEMLAERRNYIQVIALVERVCGICSNVHTLSFCQALEQLTGIKPTIRAQYIRVIVAELERLHSHLLWAGIAGEVMGFHTIFMHCFALRETVMDCLEAVSGNRVNYAMNCVGGVNRDIQDTSTLLKAVQDVEQELVRSVIPIFTTNRSVQARCRGIGVLTREAAVSYGAVGPVARASGIPQDIRKAAPYAAYGQVNFAIPVETAGDVMSRLIVRALEMIESCKILYQALAQLPAGEWQGKPFHSLPVGETVTRIEGPRGEVFYYVATNGTDIPARVRVRTPTFACMPLVQIMARGATLADIPLIQASIDPCYSCTDR